MASIINATTTNGLSTSADNSGSLQLATNNGTTAVTIDTSQNVGIGVVPSAWGSGPQAIQNSSGAIWQFGSSNIYVGQNYYFNGTNRIYTTTAEATEYQQGAGLHRWYTASSGTAGNAVTMSERMRITSGGFLFVNTTSLVGDGYVSVSFNGSANVGMGLKSTHNGSFDVMRFVNYNNVQQGYINCNNSGSTTYNSGSDYRFKDNVKPMIDGLSKVMQLKPVTFNWKGDNSAGQGFIAHELAEIVPDVVSGEKDAVTEDGTIKPQGVDYGKLTAVLASAIQELNTDLANTKLLLTEVSNKVEAQAVRIAELEGAK